MGAHPAPVDPASDSGEVTTVAYSPDGSVLATAAGGGWSSLSLLEWIATGGPDPPGCPTGFAAGPVWLLQSTHGLLDRDTVC